MYTFPKLVFVQIRNYCIIFSWIEFAAFLPTILSVPGGAGQVDKTTIRALHNCESERLIEVVLGLGYVAVFPVINTRGRHK